jgi:hypothetical protein
MQARTGRNRAQAGAVSPKVKSVQRGTRKSTQKPQNTQKSQGTQKPQSAQKPQSTQKSQSMQKSQDMQKSQGTQKNQGQKSQGTQKNQGQNAKPRTAEAVKKENQAQVKIQTLPQQKAGITAVKPQPQEQLSEAGNGESVASGKSRRRRRRKPAAKTNSEMQGVKTENAKSGAPAEKSAKQAKNETAATAEKQAETPAETTNVQKKKHYRPRRRRKPQGNAENQADASQAAEKMNQEI